MKISNDIKALIEDDIKHLTQAMLTGELSPVKPLSDYFSEGEIEQLSKEIIRYQFSSKFFSLILPYIATMKWLSLPEACLYTRHSRNTLLKWIEDGKIYASKPDGSGTYIIDRQSIDNYFNELRDNARIRSRELRRAG